MNGRSLFFPTAWRRGANIPASERSFSDEKAHILVFLADAHGGSFVFRYQYSPLTKAFLKVRT
jgi:glycosylphosphatidylinositol transamidase (GPIT) subunit GPI8